MGLFGATCQEKSTSSAKRKLQGASCCRLTVLYRHYWGVFAPMVTSWAAADNPALLSSNSPWLTKCFGIFLIDTKTTDLSCHKNRVVFSFKVAIIISVMPYGLSLFARGGIGIPPSFFPLLKPIFVGGWCLITCSIINRHHLRYLAVHVQFVFMTYQCRTS